MERVSMPSRSRFGRAARGRCARCQCKQARGRWPEPCQIQPEVKMKDGEVVSCWVGLVFYVLGAARDAYGVWALRLFLPGGLQDGGPP